jgi:low affinity Fe/Cu permease
MSGNSKRTSPSPKRSVRDVFDHVADRVTKAVGSPVAVGLAVLVIVIWAVTGPVFGFSDTWQLAINTGTTIITFLMVFVIQTTQNRDSEALHLKLDELIRAMQGARNEFITVEHESEEELTQREHEMGQIVESVAREAGHPDPEAAASRAIEAATRRQPPKSRPKAP